MLKVVFLLLGLSYLSPNSFLPWQNVIQDFFAILALLLLTITKFFNKNIQINRNILFIYLFICLIPLTQFLFNILFFKQELYLSVLYISIFFLSIFHGLNFKESLGEFTNFCLFFVGIGIACVFIQIIQWANTYFSPFILESNYLRPSANLGQPNNLATLLFICFFSNLYIYKNKKNHIYIYVIINIVLIFGIVLTQSRTSWVVFITLVILSYFKKELKLFKITILNFILFFILVLVIPYLSLLYHGKGLTVIERINSDYSRLDIWKQVIIAIANKPWIGYGWNQTSVAQTEISLKYPISIWIEYSHNLFLDLLIWNGFPLGLFIITLIVKWIFDNLIKIQTQNELIIFFMIIPFFIHCMFEFPFAYAYFLIPIGFFVGVLNREKFGNNFRLSGNQFVIFAIVILMSILVITKEYISIKNKIEIYSTRYLVSQEVVPIESNIKILDALDLNSDILYLNDCYLLKNSDLKNIKNIFYRYPSNKNLAIYYKLARYKKSKISESSKYMNWKYPSFNEKLSKKYNCNYISDMKL